MNQEIQPFQPESLSPPSIPKSKTKILLFLLIGLATMGGLVLIGIIYGIKIGKEQSPSSPFSPTPSVYISPVSDPASGWQTYKDSNGFFEVKYPKKLGFGGEEWVFEVDTDARNKTGVGNVYFGPPSTKSGGFVWGIYFSADVCLEDLINQVGSQFNDRKIVKNEINVSGKPALLVTVTTNEVENWISRSIYIKDSKFDNYYIIKNGAIDLSEFEYFYKSLRLVQQEQESETPPGCHKSDSIALTGCSGKNLTKDFMIVPSLPCCLKIWPNDCVTASLEINNECVDEVIIQAEKIKPGYSSLVYTDSSGKLEKIKKDYDTPYPDSDENIILKGSVADQEFTISYIRTRKLCE